MMARFAQAKPREWGLNLTGELTQVPKKLNAVALTFDACGSWFPDRPDSGAEYDEKLIELLRKHQVKATLLLNARWIERNEGVARELAADPLFELGNHGVRHEPLSVNGRRAYGIKGTKNLSVMYDEVVGAHEWIASHKPGERVFFRSGTAYSDEVGIALCQAMGTPFVGFTLNADGGATSPAHMIEAALGTAKPGDIVIGHMNHPQRDTAKGFSAALPKLVDAGMRFVHVADCAPKA